MRQLRIIRILRIALPIVFFAFVVVIYLNWQRGRVKPDRSNQTPPVATLTSQTAIIESKRFDDTQTIGGRVVSRIRADRLVAYTGDWNTLEGVALTIYRPNGLTYEISCPNAQFNSKTKVAEAKGGVKVTSSDGVEITTAEIHFDGSRLTNHIPVQFRIDRWTGRAGALDLDVEGETLRLFEKVEATMNPAAPTEAPMTIRAADGLFRRRENDATFNTAVEMTRAADRLTCDILIGRFTHDRKRIVGLEGTGHVDIVTASNPAPGEDLGGRKQITCERFYSELGPDGTINAINAIGEPGLAHGVFDGPPHRDLVAKNFRVAIANRAVSEIKADSQVVMKELGAAPRQINGDRMTVSFDVRTHKASSAFIDGSFKYTDPKNTASAFRANYDIPADRVLLTAEPGFDPTVVSEGQTVKAKQIEFSPRGGTAKATGSVIAQLVSKQSGPSADGTNLFPAGKPVFVNADVLNMRQANKTAVFSGNVRAWQETNTVFAQELQVQGTGDQITARGNVRTLLYNSGGTETRRTPVTTNSDQLLARRNERRIDLIGGVKIVDETRTVTGERAIMFLDANKKLERMEAEKNVVIVDSATGRKATGDKAVYLLKTKTVLLDGNPATATAPNGNLSGQQVKLDLVRNKVEIVSPTQGTQGTYKPQ